MNEFKELDVLENTEESVKERLAEEFPPQDINEKERVFRMSERKYNTKKNDSTGTHFIGGETVNGVEEYKRPKWKIFASLAACAVIVAGIGGGEYMLKHMKGRTPQTVISEINDKSTAPFGDFAASEYYLIPVDDTSNAIEVTLDCMDNQTVQFCKGEVIPFEKRKKIAEFLNSQEWIEAEPNPDDEGGRRMEFEQDELADNFMGFQCIEDDSIRNISLSSENTLIYNYYEIKTEGNSITCDTIYTQAYSIDWELFRSTINSILNDTAEGTYVENAAPFGDFSELEYYIPNSDKSSVQKIRIADSTDSGAIFNLPSGTEIDNEKRRQLADFFNSYTWEECTETEKDYDQSGSTIFLYNNGSEIRLVQITKSDILTYMHFNYINKDGELCKEPLEGAIPMQRYKIDSKLFKETIDNILNDKDEQTVNESDSFNVIVNTLEKYDDFHYQNRIEDDPSGSNRDYKLSSDGYDIDLYCGNVVANDKREEMLDIIRNASWNSESLPTDSLSDYEKNGSETDEHFTQSCSLMEITGNDFIDVQIYANYIQMSFYECEHNEEDDTFTVINERKYIMHTESPTFMTDIYNVLFDDEDIQEEAPAEADKPIEFTVKFPANVPRNVSIELIMTDGKNTFTEPLMISKMPDNSTTYSANVGRPSEAVSDTLQVTAVLTDLYEYQKKDVGTYTFDFLNGTYVTNSDNTQNVFDYLTALSDKYSG